MLQRNSKTSAGRQHLNNYSFTLSKCYHFGLEKTKEDRLKEAVPGHNAEISSLSSEMGFLQK